MRWFVLCALVGCGGGKDDEDTSGGGGGDGPPTGNGACGEVGEASIELLGSLSFEDESPAAGASVRLEERNWNTPDKIYVEAVTDGDGKFDLIADLVTVADCWGVAVDYYVVGELGGAAGERGVNSWLFNAAEGTGNGRATMELPIVLFGTVGTTGGTGGTGAGGTGLP
jgi:hypothetical protein